ncbi:MAG: SET domain-containing protein [Gammaproteobacteria bacterium]|nr:SET domain-containing protein [Gammaproteobacteria bacterium]MDH3856666.1 SET domain-containing protein [Gammaproteobacteria bacterium]
MILENTYIATSGIHGRGLFAGSYISKDTIIGWLEGSPCTSDGPHVLWINAGQGIEVLCRFRYINHSDDPNACYYDDLSVVALRDIWPGEEITHDYSCNDW